MLMMQNIRWRGCLTDIGPGAGEGYSPALKAWWGTGPQGSARRPKASETNLVRERNYVFFCQLLPIFQKATKPLQPQSGKPVWHIWHAGTLRRGRCAKILARPARRHDATKLVCQNAGTPGTPARLPAAACQRAGRAGIFGTPPRGRVPACRACRSFWHASPRPRASVPGVPEFLARLPAAACQRAGRAGIFGTPPRGRVPACQPCRNFWHASPRPRASVPGVPEFLARLPAAACQRAGRAGIFGTPPRGRVPACQPCRNFWHASPRPRASVPTVPELLARLPAAACQCANRAGIFGTPPRGRVPACRACQNL